MLAKPSCQSMREIVVNIGLIKEAHAIWRQIFALPMADLLEPQPIAMGELNLLRGVGTGMAAGSPRTLCFGTPTMPRRGNCIIEGGCGWAGWSDRPLKHVPGPRSAQAIHDGTIRSNFS
jgi:hypothetical protein